MRIREILKAMSGNAKMRADPDHAMIAAAVAKFTHNEPCCTREKIGAKYGNEIRPREGSAHLREMNHLMSKGGERHNSAKH
jgi:hypothetical protein